MKGISKYVNEYINQRTDCCFKGILTAKLHINKYHIVNKTIRFNKNIIYKDLSDKVGINSILEEALSEACLLIENMVLKELKPEWRKQNE